MHFLLRSLLKAVQTFLVSHPFGVKGLQHLAACYNLQAYRDKLTQDTAMDLTQSFIYSL